MAKQLSCIVIALAVLGSVYPVMAQPPAGTVGANKVLFEYWFNIPGVDVVDLTSNPRFPASPDDSEWRDDFMSRVDWDDNFGTRVRAYLYPAQTGEYTFWVAGDDGCELWLSTDDTRANATKIAEVTGWTPVQDWFGEVGEGGGNQQSAPIFLEAGQKYYIEGLMKEGGGGDSIGAAWAGPGIGDEPTLITGEWLSAYLRAGEPLLRARNPVPPEGTKGFVGQMLEWMPGETSVLYDIYFSTDPEPALIESGWDWGEMYYLPFDPHWPLQPDTTYYWRVDAIDADGNVYDGAVWSFMTEPFAAYDPRPVDGAENQGIGLALIWKAGKGAVGHHVYFGTNEMAVASGDASADKGIVDTAQFLTGALRSSTAYFWRVDTVRADGEVVPGEVWSFLTAEPLGPPNKIIYETWTGIGGTAVSALLADPRYPDNPTSREFIDEFDAPVDWADNFGQRLWGWLKPPETGEYTFWVAGDDEQQLWLSTDASPDNAVMIAHVPGWTAHREWGKYDTQQSEPITLQAGGIYYIMAIGKEGGGGDSTTVGWGGPTIGAGPVVITSDYVDAGGLPPLQAFSPTPANRAVDIAHAPTLSWYAGELAQQHAVYFGDDRDAVGAADSASPLFKGTQTATTYNVSGLEWGETYYWRVDEIGADETWRGNVWSFTTANFLPIDDMEEYDDDENPMWETWIDGWDNKTGSQVGWDIAVDGTFGSRTVTHGGSRQSMPLQYKNTDSPFYSETTRTWAQPQDWTINNVSDLVLYVQGYPAAGTWAPVETAGKMSVTGAGEDIWGVRDQFSYAYKTLTGDGSMIARVADNGTGTNEWAKGGVMIRETLDGNSKHAMMVITGGGGNGASFQRRIETGGTSTNTDVALAVEPPYWVKIERTGDTFTGSISPDGQAWSFVGTITVEMAETVHIGICVTSHVANVDRTFEFESISSTPSVTGQWQGAIISAARHNSPADFYVAIEDATESKHTMVDATVVNTAGWNEVKLPLADFQSAGVNLTRVKKLHLGVDNRANPAAAGSGVVFIDNIRLALPEPAEE